MTTRLGTLLTGATTTLLLCAAPPVAARQLDSFAGVCAIGGTVLFEPPVTTTEASLSYSYSKAGGRCSGTLNGRKVSDAPVKVRQSGHSRGSCQRAYTTEPGQGALIFPDGTTIAYRLQFTSLVTEIDFSFEGQRSGTAHGHGTFLTPRTEPLLGLKCYGEGISSIPMDMSLTTDSPLVSERPAPAAGPKRLRLTASPRRARVGRETKFRFRTSLARRQPAAGVVIRFAGQRARTNRAGRATIRATLRSPGKRTARATKKGFRVAVTTIRARRG